MNNIPFHFGCHTVVSAPMATVTEEEMGRERERVMQYSHCSTCINNYHGVLWANRRRKKQRKKCSQPTTERLVKCENLFTNQRRPQRRRSSSGRTLKHFCDFVVGVGSEKTASALHWRCLITTAISPKNHLRCCQTTLSHLQRNQEWVATWRSVVLCSPSDVMAGAIALFKFNKIRARAKSHSIGYWPQRAPHMLPHKVYCECVGGRSYYGRRRGCRYPMPLTTACNLLYLQ